MTKLQILLHFSNFKSLFLITFSFCLQFWGTLHGVKAALNLRIKYSLLIHNLVLGYAPFNRYLGSTILRRKSRLQRVFYLQFQHLQPEWQINKLLHNFMLHSLSLWFPSLSFSFYVLLTVAQTNEWTKRESGVKKRKFRRSWSWVNLVKGPTESDRVGPVWVDWTVSPAAAAACIIFKSLNNWKTNNSNKKQRRRRRSTNYNRAQTKKRKTEKNKNSEL